MKGDDYIMKKINIKTETIVGLGLGVLGIASALLGNKKEALAKESLKAEVLEEVMKEINSDK